jgi:F-box associated region/RING-like zinc finger
MSTFVDDSTECAICLIPFHEDTATAITTLACGHRWHTDCLREQLRTAQPNHAQRLVFTGCRCAKCGTFCDDDTNPELQEFTRKTDGLRQRVDELIREQLRVDNAVAARQHQQEARPSSTSSTEDDRKVPAMTEKALMEYGRRTYAFYLCAGCESPYFGGTIACADDAVEGERPSEDRYCPNCVPNGVGCRRLQEHQGLQIFKCRYCCQPADFVCYGTVHVCTPCHDRNSARVRQQGNGTNGAKRPMLSAIHCPGSSCFFPKTNGAVFHQNGNSAKCEQVYYCAGCESSATSLSAAFLPLIPPGGPNWIQNPSGETGNINHWTPHQRGTTWKVETSEDGPNTASNFVSTYYPCIMSQSVPLVQYVTNPDIVTIEVSARFRGRHDCASVFRLLVTRQNRLGHTIEQRDTGNMAAPVDAWERTSLILTPMADTHTIVMTILGQDRPFWAGNFGSKAKDCSVRVLGDNLDGILLLPAPLSRHGT